MTAVGGSGKTHILMNGEWSGGAGAGSDEADISWREKADMPLPVDDRNGASRAISDPGTHSAANLGSSGMGDLVARRDNPRLPR